MEYAGLGRRAVAFLIDAVAVAIFSNFAVPLFIAVVLVFTLGPRALESPERVNAVVTLTIFSVPVLTVIYFALFEGLTGYTLGKKILKIRVVRVDGSPCGVGASVVRNLLRVIDGLFFYVVGALLIWLSETRQRLGDKAAKTVVIRQ